MARKVQQREAKDRKASSGVAVDHGPATVPAINQGSGYGNDDNARQPGANRYQCILRYRPSELIDPNTQRESGQARTHQRYNLAEPDQGKDRHLRGNGLRDRLIYSYRHSIRIVQVTLRSRQ